MNSSPVRVRFAPSPTGYLHVGGARTALFNWLFARHSGGRFVLRIEDTDKERNTAEAVQVIYDGLRWLGLDWDEGPGAGGEHGPYFQSERETVYQRYFDRLKADGRVYDDGGAWRFRFRREMVKVDDLICGEVNFDFANVEITPDMTVRRPDGSWIFHFVNVVDDIEMGITHVIRGEDHLSNTPKHLQLYEALGAPRPRFGHIPLILNPDGSKMSKRDKGASVSSYVEGGYAPEAVRNYLVLLGWSPKDEREIFSLEELVARFELANVNRKGAQFDLAKCDWMNAQYIQQMPMVRYRELARPWLAQAGIIADDAALEAVLALEKMKVTHFTELPHRVSFFFTEEYAFDPEAVEKTLRKPGALDRLAMLMNTYSAVDAWDATTLEAKLKETAAAVPCKPAEFIHPARVAVSGRSIGPSLYHMLEVLGKARVLARVQRTIERFQYVKETYSLEDLRAWPSATGDEKPPLRLAVFGDPVAHSASPPMHNAALAALGIDARYCRLHIRPEELATALRLLPARGFIGVNCTIPHKVAALPLMDRVDEHARRIGVVNTVVVEGERLIGFNTDGPGLVRALRADFGVDLRDLRVMILGAGGGAGRAIAMQCGIENCERLVLVNRTPEKARELAVELALFFRAPRVFGPGDRLEVAAWEESALRAQIGHTDLIINCTSVGMKPSDPSPLPSSLLQPHLMVYDTIYSARRTRLMQAADEAGARSANGLSMLLNQGALSFEIWFNREAPLVEMRAALLAHAASR